MLVGPSCRPGVRYRTTHGGKVDDSHCEAIELAPHVRMEENMAKKGWTWVFNPKSLPKPKVPDDLKAEVQDRANQLVEEFLKPNFIKKPPKNTSGGTSCLRCISRTACIV